MLRLARTFSFFCLFAAISFAVSAAEIQPVKYVFLFIGDGMSIAQQQMGEEFLQKTEQRGLKINTMPYKSLTTTHAAGDEFVTDSAAAATAIACGVKTDNRAIGLDAEGNRAESIAELARKNGRKIGIISSVTINHATPAGFYAHNTHRNNEYEIALDMIASGFDYFGGGGVAQNNDRNAEKYAGDIYDLAKEAGYTLVRTTEAIRSLKPAAENVNKKVMAFPHSSAIPYAIDSSADDIRLPEFTRQAIELLDNPNGFFIMVEGGAIDWACHDNDGATAIRDLIEFDDAVSVAFNFAEKHPGEVLIVVTGDHETGMLSVSNSSTVYQVYVSLLANQKASGGTLITMTERFVKEGGENATFDNYKVFITENTGLVFTEEGHWQPGNLNLTQNEMRELENDFNRTKAAIVLGDAGRGKDRVVRTMIRILNNKSGLTWGGGGHTGMPVITATWGNQAESIAKAIKDNTDIAKQLKQAVSAISLSP